MKNLQGYLANKSKSTLVLDHRHNYHKSNYMHFYLVSTMYSGCKYRIGAHSLVRRDGVTNGASAKAESENGVAIINV